MSCMGDRRDPLGTNALLSHRSKDSAVFKLHEDGSTFRRGAPGGHSAFSAENDPTCAIGCVSILQNSHLQLTSWTRCANRRLCAVCSQMRRVSPWEKCLTKRDSQSRIPVHVFLTLLHKNGSSVQVASASDCQVVRIEDIDVVNARARFTRRKVERHGSWHRIGRGNQRDRGSFKERPVEYQTAKLHLQPQSASQHSSRWPTRVESEAGTQSRPCCTCRLPGAFCAFVGKGHCDFNGWRQLHVLIVSAFSY